MSTLQIVKPDHSGLVGKLRHLMNEDRVNEAELSRRTQIPQATLHKILAGKTTDPRGSTLKTLADYFSVSVDELLCANPGKHHGINMSIETQSVPVISWTDCTHHETTIDTIAPSSWKDWVVIEYLEDYAFGLSTKPSMEPRFPKSSLLIIDPVAEATDGDLVIVQYPGTKEATIRELTSDGPIRLLLPINHNAEKEQLTDDIKIIGIVAQSRFSYSDN